MMPLLTFMLIPIPKIFPFLEQETTSGSSLLKLVGFSFDKGLGCVWSWPMEK